MPVLRHGDVRSDLQAAKKADPRAAETNAVERIAADAGALLRTRGDKRFLK
jgi:hypothetical protein